MKQAPLLAAAALFCMSLPAMAQRAAPPVNPYHGNTQAAEQGRDIYNHVCTACHGIDGTAGEMAPALGAAGHVYARTSDTQIFEAVKNGIPDTGMRPLGARLSDDDIWKVTAYIEALRGTAIDAPLAGDVAHGNEIFWGKGQCSSCHMIDGKGGLVGPDLSDIAGIRKASSIIDALTKPEHKVFGVGGSRQVVLRPLGTYQPVTVTIADGETVDGVLLNQDNFSIEIMGKDSQLHLFDRTKVKVVIGTKSLMPTDYDKRLAPDEFKDLLAFLTHQGTKPTPPPARGAGGPSVVIPDR